MSGESGSSDCADTPDGGAGNSKSSRLSGASGVSGWFCSETDGGVPGSVGELAKAWAGSKEKLSSNAASTAANLFFITETILSFSDGNRIHLNSPEFNIVSCFLFLTQNDR